MACKALGVARATFYRRRKPRATGQRRPRPKPARALSEAERGEVFDVLCSRRFADRAPAEVYATLLDEGVYLCSERTMYRILGERRAVRERRAQRSHPNHPKPEVVARAPNQAWSWDVTRLMGPKKGRHLYLYVILGSSPNTDLLASRATHPSPLCVLDATAGIRFRVGCSVKQVAAAWFRRAH